MYVKIVVGAGYRYYLAEGGVAYDYWVITNDYAKTSSLGTGLKGCTNWMARAKSPGY